MALAVDERTFVFALLDEMTDFEEKHPPPAPEKKPDPPRKRVETKPRMKASEAEGKVLAALVADPPGLTMAEISRASGVATSTVQSVLQRCADELVRVENRYRRKGPGHAVDSGGGGGGREVEAGSVG